MSEHLSFNTANLGGKVTRTGMLMPPLQTPEGVECAVRCIGVYSAALNRPLAIETGNGQLLAADHLRPAAIAAGVVLKAGTEVRFPQSSSLTGLSIFGTWTLET